jgi:DNA-binding MarR family transcriptional regulator
MSPANPRDGVDEVVAQWAAVRPELDVSAMKVFGRLHRSFLLYRAAIGAGFAEMGTNEAGFDVLATLRRSGPDQRLTAGELARRTLVTTGGITLRVKRLEQAGLVRRERDPDDNRVVYVELTPAGLELVDRVALSHFRTLLHMLEGLSARERNQLAVLLRSLHRSLEATVPDPGGSDDD